MVKVATPIGTLSKVGITQADQQRLHHYERFKKFPKICTSATCHLFHHGFQFDGTHEACSQSVFMKISTQLFGDSFFFDCISDSQAQVSDNRLCIVAIIDVTTTE